MSLKFCLSIICAQSLRHDKMLKMGNVFSPEYGDF